MIDLSIRDSCTNCGHYHNTEADSKPRQCVRGKDCYCSVSAFVGRTMKGKFA